MTESNSVEDIKKALGAEIVDVLNVFEKDGNVCLKPKSFLGSEVFKDIAQRIKELGGHYENGLFRIPLETKGSKKDLTPLDELHQLVMDLRNHVEKETEKIVKKISNLKR